MEQATQVFAAASFLVIGLSHLFQPRAWVAWFQSLAAQGPSGAFTEGFLSVSFGAIVAGFHNVWHGPRSNWMRRELTGAHLTLKLANSGRTSVGRARFKSLLAHVNDWPRVPDPGLRPLGQRTSPVGHPRCLVVAVAAACSSSSTSGARLSHLSHVVCVGRSTRRSEV